MPAQPKQQPFQWMKAPIPFSGGVDTRSDRKSIPVPKLGLLENAVFTTPGVLRKRFGYQKLADLSLDGFGTPPFYDQPIADARMILTRGNSLWLRASENIYALGADRKRWQRRAQIPSARFVYGPRLWPGASSSISNTERATANGVTMFAVDDFASGSGVITVYFVDANGAELFRHSFVGEYPRAVVVGTVICLFYVNQPTADTLFVWSYNTTDLRGPNPFSPNKSTVASDLNTTAPSFDIDTGFDGRILVAYNTTTANTLKFGYVLPNGTLDGALTTITTAATPGGVACAVEPTAGTLLVCWLMTGTLRVDGQMFNAAKSSLFASAILGTTTSYLGLEAVTCIFRSATTAEVFFDFRVATPAQYRRVEKATLTTAGVVVQFVGWLRHATLASKPWLINGRVHLLTNRPGFSDPFSVQRTAFVVASGGVQDPTTLGAIFPNEGLSFSAGGLGRKVSRVDVVGTTVWLTPRLVNTLDPTAAKIYSGNVGVDYSYTPVFVEAGNGTYFTGTSLWMIDGPSVIETGFNEFPEVDNSVNYVSTSTTGGGLVAGQTYSYRFYYEWFSAAGELWQSTCASDVIVPLGVGKDTITVNVPTLTHTLKTGVQIAGYRTLAAGTVFHRVGSINNSTAADFVAFTDTMTDAVAASQPFDYRSTVPQELSNLAPAGGTVVAVGNTRVFASGFEDPNLVVASKLRGFGVALNWNPAVQIALPEAGGSPVTALAALGDSLVAFRATHCYLIGGDGPDNVGASGSFMPPRVISDDVGCAGPACIVRTPVGLIFKSSKGIYLLGLDLSLAYVGADVEGYNSQTVTAAVSLPDRHEVRFTLSSGKTLVLDYLAKQWSVFTVGGLHAVIWQGRHVYLPDNTGSARAELAGSYVDDGQPYSWALETAWIHIGENQNHQRVRAIQLLGEWMGDHSAVVQVAYNYENAFSDRIPIDISAVLNGSHYGDDLVYGGFTSSAPGTFGGNVGALSLVSTGVYQLKLQPRRMRCQSIKLRWEETRRTDPAGIIQYPWLEGARLNEVAFEIGLRGGLWQPGVDRTFGG